jgi:glycosyltransferase involved in cell wall biosynthesis
VPHGRIARLAGAIKNSWKMPSRWIAIRSSAARQNFRKPIGSRQPFCHWVKTDRIKNMAKTADLFVGITSWNSEKFLGRCIESIKTNTPGVTVEIYVVDNCSTDESVNLAKRHGGRVVVKRCNQGDAINYLVRESNAPYVLLMHADVVLLDKSWYEKCSMRCQGDTVLVSPEDIGCGPLSRPFGRGKPESSFLFFNRRGLVALRHWRWSGRRLMSVPRRAIDFYGPHVTHNLPTELSRRGLSWFAMDVLISPRVDKPIYVPDWRPAVWSDELPYLRYGLGNFYALDGVVTHYHNWYDRCNNRHLSDPRATTEPNGAGFPLAYIAKGTENFIRDFDEGRLRIPDPKPLKREPRAL